MTHLQALPTDPAIEHLDLRPPRCSPPLHDQGLYTRHFQLPTQPVP